MSISPKRAGEIVDALRRGTVPRSSLDAFCVGLDRFETAIDADLDAVAGGRGVFKAIRGDYGCGKTFFSRWIQERAKQRNFAAAAREAYLEVQLLELLILAVVVVVLVVGHKLVVLAALVL